MTYSASESSQYGGKPVELYRFTRGLRIWTYTTADTPITYLGEVYQPATMHRGDVAQENETDDSALDLNLDATLDVVAEFIAGATPTPTNLTVYRRHRDEGSPTEQAVIFQGQVGVVELSEGDVHIICVPMQKAIQRKIPRWLYQTQCNHMLYDRFCGVDPAAFTFSGHISALAGIVLTVPEAAGKPDGYYNGGFLKDGTTYAFIQTHVGTQITLLAASPALAVTDVITLTAGCDRTRTTCVTKFSNLDNFMGFPYIPTKNPYGAGGLT